MLFFYTPSIQSVIYTKKESVELYAPLLYMQALGKPL